MENFLFFDNESLLLMKRNLIAVFLFLIVWNVKSFSQEVKDIPEIMPFEEAMYPPDYQLPPIRAITHGPSYHWFGYYDVNQFDPSGRYALGMEVDFDCRSPRANDTIRLGMIDLENNDQWIEIGTTTAWGWQLGCRLQWRPGSDSEVMWNARSEDGDHTSL